MPTPPTSSIRELLLTETRAQRPRSSLDAPLTQTSILNAVANELGVRHNPEIEEAILTQWGDLFRTGLLAWGLNLANPNPPFFHLTQRGRQALQNLTRDPSNPSGYLHHLAIMAQPDAVALSYLKEALECYVAGLFKAAAVMVGGAAERVILTLRDDVANKMTSLGRTVPRGLNDWRIRVVSDALQSLFEQHRSDLTRELREALEAYWSAFVQQIRTVRNDAGHPESVEPVTADTVHASLLIFPELAKLASALGDWVNANFT